MFWNKSKNKKNGDAEKKNTASSSQSSQSNNVQIRNSSAITSTYSSYTVETKTKITYGSSSSLTNSSKNQISSVKSTPLFEMDAQPIALGIQSIKPNYISPFSRNTRPYNSVGSSTRSSNLSSFTSARPRSSVIGTTTYNTTTSIVPTYNTNGSKRGIVLIINNIKFLTLKDDRTGAEIDEVNISKLFEDMGFEVKKYRNLKASEIENKINNFRKDYKSLSKVDISILIVMSHGSNLDNNNVPIQGNFTQVAGIDNKNISIDQILANFTTDKCPGMKGKPKIFIFQCCRGVKGDIAVDASPIVKQIKQHADMLIAYSTLPGFYSLRDTKKGSWYIQCICEVFRNYAKVEDIESLLKIVDERLSYMHPTYKQTSTYESRGFKKCFLNPKW